MLYIASDHAGFQLKNKILQKFKAVDLGTDSKDSCHYPQFAEILANKMKKGDKGILVCGSGVGVSIVANKIQGIMCANVQDSYNAQLAAKMGCNVISFGERVIGEQMAIEIIQKFLETQEESNQIQQLVQNWEQHVYK